MTMHESLISGTWDSNKLTFREQGNEDDKDKDKSDQNI